MNYANVKYYDIANGLGIRTSLFVSGCRNHCEGCFQPETWNFKYGKPFDEKIQKKIIESLQENTCDGLTILGGEPFEPENQPEILNFIDKVKETVPEKNIWMFTGNVYEDFLPKGKRYLQNVTERILDSIDVLVDGPFILAQKNLMLKFRGSENQRLIDVPATRKSGNITLLKI